MYYVLLVDKKASLYVGKNERVPINKAEHYDQSFYNAFKNHITSTSTWVRINSDGSKENVINQ
jgi:hypothetical protein